MLLLLNRYYLNLINKVLYKVRVMFRKPLEQNVQTFKIITMHTQKIEKITIQ